MVSKQAVVPKEILDAIADLNLKNQGLAAELDQLKAGQVSKVELVEQFKKHNEAINALFAKYDKDVRQFITDQIVSGVTEGIKQYDAAAKQNFLTKGDLAAAGSVDPTQGTAVQRGAPQGQGGGFIDTLGRLVMGAITGPNTTSGGQDMFAMEFAKYRGLFERRMQLEWTSFLKERFGPLPAAAESSGHVELQG